MEYDDDDQNEQLLDDDGPDVAPGLAPVAARPPPPKQPPPPPPGKQPPPPPPPGRPPAPAQPGPPPAAPGAPGVPGAPVDHPWFYLDPKGAEQGPFPTHFMATWWREGHFIKHLKVRRGNEQNHTYLYKRKDIVLPPIDAQKLAAAKARFGGDSSSDDGEEEETAPGHTPAPPPPSHPPVHAPPPPPPAAHAQHAHAVAEVVQDPSGTGAWYPDGEGGHIWVPAAPAAVAERAPDKNWLYLDMNNQEQGPYPSPFMEEWWRLGHFHQDLMVRAEGETEYTLLKSRLDFNFPAPENVPHQEGGYYDEAAYLAAQAAGGDEEEEGDETEVKSGKKRKVDWKKMAAKKKQRKLQWRYRENWL